MANYVAKTDSTHSKWWIINSGSGSRLSDIIDDIGDGATYGPYYDVASAWTQSPGDAAEYYHAPTKRPDVVVVSGVTLAKQADDTCIDGGGGGLANDQWCWETVNSRVYVQIAAGSPGANADFYYLWNGSVSGTDFLTEVVEDVFYEIHLDVEIGDGTTSTTMNWLETVYFMDNPCYKVKSNATLTIGSIDGSGYSASGAYISTKPDANHGSSEAGATLNIYGSVITNRSTTAQVGATYGTITIKNSTIYGRFAYTYILLTLSNVIYANSGILYLYPIAGSSMSDLNFENITTLYTSALHVLIMDASLLGVGALNSTSNNSNDTIFRDPRTSIESITKVIASDIACGLIEDYTVSISVVDKDGNALSGASLSVYDDANNDVTHAVVATTLSSSFTSTATSITVGNGALFSINDYIRLGAEWLQITNIVGNVLTVTRSVYGSPYIAQGHNSTSPIYKLQSLTSNASGVFSDMYLPYKFWMTTAETEYNPNPYKIVISKSGYETLTLENITIDSPIDWHLELQDPAVDHGAILLDLKSKRLVKVLSDKIAMGL